MCGARAAAATGADHVVQAYGPHCHSTHVSTATVSSCGQAHLAMQASIPFLPLLQ